MLVSNRWMALFLLFISSISAYAVELTEENVNEAVRKAVEFIKQTKSNELHWESSDEQTEDRFYGGDTGLALLALLYAGEDPRSTEMSESLKWLARAPLKATYTIGTRAHVFALVPGRAARSVLQQDVDWLLGALHPANSSQAGAYGYESPASGWDNSNSQYGVLGVWMAAEAGLRIRSNYWDLIFKHWLDTQRPDGGWDYNGGGDSTGSMTAAGLATLFVLYDYRRRDLDDLVIGIDRALQWTSQYFSTDNPNGDKGWKYYYLYGIERVGRASGRKYFRNRDWFKAGASHLLETQQADGSWPTSALMSPLRNTSFALMFLCHGRAPVLYSKLEYIPDDIRTALDDALTYEPNNPRHNRLVNKRRLDWNQYPRDLAGLTRAAQAKLEALLNWQIVDLNAPLVDLLESPVLYMSGSRSWIFTDDETSKLREYALRGGLIFAVPAGRSSQNFFESMKKLAGDCFPSLALEPVRPDHPLLSGDVGREFDEKTKLHAVRNGRRILMLISDNQSSINYPRSWQNYKPGKRNTIGIELGLNVYLYATDKSTPESRLAPTILTENPIQPTNQVLLARIKHAGNWNHEPYGWLRLETYLHNRAATNLMIGWGITFDSPKLRTAQVAHITGQGRLQLSEAEKRGLRKYLTEGGLLIADPVCGDKEFYDSLLAIIQDALPGGSLQRIPAKHPLITGKMIPGGISVAKSEFRRAARRFSRGESTPQIWAYNLQKQPAVLLSPIDLSTGLLGSEVYGCVGYAPRSSIDIMRNFMLYAMMPSLDKARLNRE